MGTKLKLQNNPMRIYFIGGYNLSARWFVALFGLVVEWQDVTFTT